MLSLFLSLFTMHFTKTCISHAQQYVWNQKGCMSFSNEITVVLDLMAINTCTHTCLEMVVFDVVPEALRKWLISSKYHIPKVLIDIDAYM